MNEPLKRPAAKIVTTFGAALTTAWLAPHAEADIVALTPTPGMVQFGSGLDVELIPGVASFFQFNDPLGKTIDPDVYDGALRWRLTSVSNSVTSLQSFVDGLAFGASAAGVQTLGFVTPANQLGWIRIDFGGTGGDVRYLRAAYNDTPGASIHVAAEPVAEPALAALGVLALGALGVHRFRQRRAMARYELDVAQRAAGGC